ncbi:hypothetical protein JXB37_03830 [candidate division WOR-3 bacterium]|nr:hypothetical protein [candidate division WOR-3 bacterium]
MRRIALAVWVLAALGFGQHWEHELVDAGGVDPGVRMAWGPDSLLYLCYTGDSGRTRLARKDSCWHFEDVPQSVTSTGCLPSFAFGPDGEVAVTYLNGQEAWLSVRRGTAWASCSVPYRPRNDWPVLPVTFDSLGRALVPVTFDPFGGGWALALGLACLQEDSTWSINDTIDIGPHGPRYYVVGFGRKSDLSPWGAYVVYVYDIAYLYMGIYWFEWRGAWELGRWFGAERAFVGPGCGSIDRRDSVHAAYYCSDTTQFGVWFDRARLVELDPECVALAFDSCSRPFIALTESESLRFCHRDGRGWHFLDVNVPGVNWADITAEGEQPLIAYQTDAGLFLARGVGIVGVEDGAEGGRLKAEPEFPSVLRGPELLLLDCRVLDIQGRDVTDRRERLAPGVYFIGEGSRIPGFEGSRVRKVVVQR